MSTSVLDRPATADDAEGADSAGGTAPVSTEGPDAPPTAPPQIADADAAVGTEAGGSGEPVPGSLEATVGIVQRFSTAAAISVVLLIVAGVALGSSEVGSFAALTGTDYGRILLVKVGVVAIIGFVAAYNRYLLLPWLFGPHDTDPSDEVADPVAEERARWQSLLSTVRIEAIGIVIVLAITAVLTNTTPGSTTVVPSGPFQQNQAFGSGTVSLTITPNAPGANSLHLDFLGPDGRPADLAQKVTVESTLPSKDLGPITREMVKAGTGHFLLENVSDLSIGGDWTVTLIVRVSDFDQKRVPFQDTVA
jgi:copper transport protein